MTKDSRHGLDIRAAVDEQESVQVPEGMNMRIPMHSQNRSPEMASPACIVTIKREILRRI